ncbi:MAG TPA: SDR family oxidoreductase [Gammaproteobacteria bacterium]|nr:SDR family oxidoreductase [Gammaproteobacteria bacterium]
MQKTALITGGGTGLGQAITKQLAQKGMRVYIVGRRLQKLCETQAFYPNNIIPIRADVSTPAGRKMIAKKLKGIQLDYLVNNAAVVTPIIPLSEISLKDFRKTHATNVEGPLFLTQLLLPQLNKNARVLLISSDCAKLPLAHWATYCSSKAALSMIYGCLKKEFMGKAIHIGCIDPGMMDTPMQRYICQDEILFPEKYSWEELIHEKLLLSPDFSASICVKLLLELSPEAFSQQEFCAYDER